MKRYLLALLILMLSQTGIAEAAEEWSIPFFEASYEVMPSGAVEVTEMIGVDFGGSAKHGIFRRIPVDYLDQYKNRRNIELTVFAVLVDGNDVTYTTYRDGRDLVIKIGDPQRTIDGEHVYKIGYQVERVVNYFEKHDEFYWNVTGDDWPVSIDRVKAEIGGNLQATKAVCYTGLWGESGSNCEVNRTARGISITRGEPLVPGENLTIVAGFEKGLVKEPSMISRIGWRLKDNWGYFIPIATLLALVFLYMKQGRDNYYVDHFDSRSGEKAMPLFARPVIGDVYYPPKDVQAAEAGLIVDEWVGSQDIAAVLIQLANKGHLTIEALEKKDYRFTKTDKGRSVRPLENYEKVFMDGLFAKGETVTLKDLKYEFNTTAEKVRVELYKWSVSSGHFVGRPDTVRVIYIVLGVGVLVAGIVLTAVGSETMLGSAPGIGMILSGLMIGGTSFGMPKRTAKGRQALLKVLGLKRVIKLGAYRQEIFERHNYFTEILPFAIAFGLTKQWASTVEKLKLDKPDWYRSTETFSAASFGRSMSSFSTQAANTMVATRSSTSASSGGSGFSSGGGSSGGGFGGGGGGSW